jgi:flagellar FliL protein
VAEDSSIEPVEGEAPVATPAKRKITRKTAIIAAVGGVVLLGGGGGAYMMLAGGAPAETEAAAEGHGGGGGEAHAKGGGEEGEGGEGAHEPFDVPPIMVNLRSADGAPHFLKVHVMLLPGPKATEESLKAKLPLVLDAYQPFLRELRPEDLAGSAAVFRIKEELLLRTREAVGEGEVAGVLIQDLIQQ